MSLSGSFTPSSPYVYATSPTRDDAIGSELPAYTHWQDSLGRARSDGFTSTAQKMGTGTSVKLELDSDRVSANSLPIYTEGAGEPVRGRVTLSLPSPRTVREVAVEIRGSLALDSASASESFLRVPFILWTSSPATQRRPPSPDSISSSDTAQSENQKLFGQSSWSFSIDLPKEVLILSGPRKEPGIYKLPHSFTERHSRLSIAYEVCVRVRRGRFASDYRTSLTFLYIPATRPGPPSLLRQIAYQEGSSIPSPDLDPEGWYTSSPLQLNGSIFGRMASVTCILSLPKPLVYARETPIPISLLLESDDSGALDILSSPQVITARLRRTIKYRSKRNSKFDPQSCEASEYSQLASWWGCSEPDSSTRCRRRICGELHVHKDTQPTTAIADFRIEYALALLPFDNTAFQATSDRPEPLITIPVEIATLQAHGPQPRMYLPPSYDSTDTRHIDCSGS